MHRCEVVDCRNKGKHKFPKDIKIRNQWVLAIRRKNWKPNTWSMLCGDHFKPDDYHMTNSYTGERNKHNVLKRTSVPSIFSFTKVKVLNPLAQQRSERLQERIRKKLCFEIANEPISGPSIIQSKNKYSEKIPVQMETDIHHTHSHIELLGNDQPCTSAESKTTQVDFEHIYGSIERFKDKDSVIAFYTGFETYAKFYFVFSTLSPMAHLIKYHGNTVKTVSIENQFFLTMMKLRQNKCNFELAQFFQISPTTVHNIFITWINFIDQLWKKLSIWPEKDLVLYYMPNSFKQYDKNTRVIIDGTELYIQKPENPVSQQATWSSYKHNNTLKVLVGATPGGLLSYCSPTYAGSISDRQTVERSNLLKMCEPGDSILADQGYNIQDLFIGKDIKLNIPTFLKGKGQIPSLKLLKDRKLASQRVHIERLISLIKTYKIVREELHHNFVPLASKIFFVCLMCCNFRECIIQ